MSRSYGAKRYKKTRRVWKDTPPAVVQEDLQEQIGPPADEVKPMLVWADDVDPTTFEPPPKPETIKPMKTILDQKLADLAKKLAAQPRPPEPSQPVDPPRKNLEQESPAPPAPAEVESAKTLNRQMFDRAMERLTAVEPTAPAPEIIDPDQPDTSEDTKIIESVQPEPQAPANGQITTGEAKPPDQQAVSEFLDDDFEMQQL